MPSKEIIVEVGSGIRPFPTTGKRSIDHNEHYIGIDKTQFKEYVRFAKNKLREASSNHNGQMDIFRGETSTLPFKDGCISEMVCCNVLDGRVIDPKDLTCAIKEARRVLKNGGRLVVVETYTPHDAPFHQVKKTLENNGFKWIDNDELQIYDTSRIMLYKFGPNDVNYTKYQDVDWKKHPPYAATFVKV